MRPHGDVLAWFDSAHHTHIDLSAVSAGEIQIGIEAVRDKDRDQAAFIERWLERVVETFTVLPLDALAFRPFPRLMRGKSDALVINAMIAATAQTRNLIVVTRDTVDFGSLGVESSNPFLTKRS